MLPEAAFHSFSFPITTHHHSKLTWIKPVRYWHKAFRKACPNHSVPQQIIATFLALLSSIVHAVDGPRRRRPKVNTTSTRGKRKGLSGRSLVTVWNYYKTLLESSILTYSKMLEPTDGNTVIGLYSPYTIYKHHCPLTPPYQRIKILYVLVTK